MESHYQLCKRPLHSNQRKIMKKTLCLQTNRFVLRTSKYQKEKELVSSFYDPSGFFSSFSRKKEKVGGTQRTELICIKSWLKIKKLGNIYSKVKMSPYHEYDEKRHAIDNSWYSFNLYKS